MAAIEMQSRSAWKGFTLELAQRRLRHAFAAHCPTAALSARRARRPTLSGRSTIIDAFPLMDEQTLRRRQEAVRPFGDIFAAP
jgi:hypothetical protein